MIQALMTTLHRRLALPALGVFLGVFFGVLMGVPAPASARIWVGFGFPIYGYGPPAYYPPPVYYPPPAYYPPPSYYPPPPYSAAPLYAPPATQYAPASGAASAGQSCNTGNTVCPMERAVPAGASCYCTTAEGRFWGRAN